LSDTEQGLIRAKNNYRRLDSCQTTILKSEASLGSQRERNEKGRDGGRDKKIRERRDKNKRWKMGERDEIDERETP